MIRNFDGDTVVFLHGLGPAALDGRNPTAWVADVEFSDIALGDVDGDGDLDLVGTRVWAVGLAEVWLNGGTGTFTDSGRDMGALATGGAHALGDLDGDGDLDLVPATYNSATADQIFLNDGSGSYATTGQTLGDYQSSDVALADHDGDGDLDMIANPAPPAAVSVKTAPGFS